MTRRLALAALAATLCITATAHADFTTPRPSPNATVTQTIGTTTMSVKYSRPGVKGRTIWGALVPYDKPWRTGANEITQFTTSDTIQVEGKMLPAGTYGLVTIPGKEQWTVAFTKDKDLWGAFDYTPDHDQLRVSVKPQAATANEEWMEFTFEPVNAGEADVVLAWEKLRVPFHVTVPTRDLVLRSAREAVAKQQGDAWRVPYRAANWGKDNGVAADEVAKWADQALRADENFFTLTLSAKVAKAAGRDKDAVAKLAKALDLAKNDKSLEAEEVDPVKKLYAEWTAKK